MRGDLKTFDYYPYNAGLKLFNNSTATFKLAIVTDAYASVLKAAVDPVLGDFTEATPGGNYTVGGNALPGNAWTIGAVSPGVTALDFTDFAMSKDASNPTDGRTAIIVNSTGGIRTIHAIDLTTDGSTAVDLVNNDLTITFNANGTLNATVTA